MSTATVGDARTVARRTAASPGIDLNWRTAALAMLAVRFVQGFIYWGGGSRRFIYAPSKLDPHATQWMAYKFQTAMPGALLGMDEVISYLLQHFVLLYAAVILFSAAELISGAMLISGLLTRAAAAVSVVMSFFLMLMFGWQGATCIDEWTMAAANFAMGMTLVLAGSGSHSLDNLWLRRNPALAEKGWFRWLGGSLPLPLSERGYKRLAFLLFWVAVVFIVSTYHYYRGSVVTPFHGGPVSPSHHHVSLSDGRLGPDGGVRFHAYLDGGTPDVPAYFVEIVLRRASGGETVERWDTAALGALPASAFHNEYDYQKFKTGPYGIVAGMGAKATVDLPAAGLGVTLPSGGYELRVIDVSGRVFTVPLTVGTGS